MKTRFYTLLCILALLALVSPTQAAVWSSSGWSFSPQMTTRVGYDSNLFARSGSEDDAYAEFEPVFILTRRPSQTFLSIEAGVRAVMFVDWPEQNSVDPSVRARYRYPDDESLLATGEMNVSLSRASVSNSDVGRRVRETDLFFRWEGTVSATPKTALQARLSARQISYEEEDLNTNDRVEGGLTLAFLSSEKLQLGAGYDFSFSRSTPETGAKHPTHRVENALTIRARGEFAPNVSGRLHGGLANGNYSGAQNRSELDVVAGANIEWKIQQRRYVTATADRSVYFSPEGDAVTSTSAGFELHQEISGGYTAMLGVQAVRAVYRRGAIFRRDNSFPVRAALDYAINPRFGAAIEGSWSKHNSDWEFRNYRRTTVAARANYRF